MNSATVRTQRNDLTIIASPRPSRGRESVEPERTPIVGASPVFAAALALARQFAPTPLPILLLGETGTGKEVFAREIHALSRRPGLFVDVNCGALPREMVESLLFGHRRGAFTGAFDHAKGLIEEADGGTLFLDEVLSMPIEAQAKLLRVLETGEVRAIGETGKRRVDVRVVAAAQPTVSEMVHDGGFRADLLQRLAGVVIRIPSLSERADDVVTVAEHFAAIRECRFGPGVADVLRAHTWPGNVRELKLAMERACFMSESYKLPTRVVADAIALGAMWVAPARSQLVPALAEFRSPGDSVRDRVIAICAANGWNATRSARALGLGRTTFFKRLKALGISLREGRSSLEFRVGRQE
jgi:DNA-binding NtrC family response regulator